MRLYDLLPVRLDERPMPLSVSQLLAEPALELQLLVTGRLERTVRWVQVSEVPSPGPPYLRGGEVVLSAGLWRHEGDAESFVRALVASNVAALGCGLRTNVVGVDQRLVEACERAGLTLFSVPHATTFSAIVEYFVTHLDAERQQAQQSTIDRSARLVRALGTGPSGTVRILRVLGEELRRDVWLVDHRNRIVEVPGSGRRLPRDLLLGRPSSSVPAAVEHLGLEAVPVGRTSDRAWVLLAQSETSGDDGVVEQTLPFLASALAREAADMEAERRHAIELLELVHEGHERFASARLESLGFDLSQPLVALAVREASGESVEGVRRVFDALELNAVVARRQDHTHIDVLVHDAHGRGLDELGAELARALGPGTRLGIGSAGPGVRRARRSLIEARHALDLAETRTAPRPWVTSSSLRTFRALLETHDVEVLEAFREAMLGPIQDHDRKRGGDLLPTLTRFLESNGQWRATADALHIHVNTLRHRLARCEELSQRDLSRMEDRVDLFLAIRAVGHPVVPGPLADADD